MKKKTRRRKLDTPEDIDRVCHQYYLTNACISVIARVEKVCTPIIDRVLNENGARYVQEHEKEIDEFRQTNP